MSDVLTDYNSQKVRQIGELASEFEHFGIHLLNILYERYLVFKAFRIQFSWVYDALIFTY